MKTAKFFVLMHLLMAFLALTSCRRNTDDVWEDTKSAGRHMGRGVRTLGGKHGDSRQVVSRDEFYAGDVSDDSTQYVGQSEQPSGDFIPLSDVQNQNDLAMGESIAPQPKENPGDPGSSIPGIESFRDPSTIPGLSGIFKSIQFEYNSNLVKGPENVETIRKVADYMKANPRTYVFVEGHCDERGPEAYNYALGSRRSNAVRNMLIEQGVNHDNLFTISYGKDRPLLHDHNEEAWSQNRRADFKIYQK